MELAETRDALYEGEPVPDGAIYTTEYHDMRVNSAWILGLAHRAVPVVMTAALDDATVVRQSLHESARNTASNASAQLLGRLARARRDGCA